MGDNKLVLEERSLKDPSLVYNSQKKILYLNKNSRKISSESMYFLMVNTREDCQKTEDSGSDDLLFTPTGLGNSILNQESFFPKLVTVA